MVLPDRVEKLMVVPMRQNSSGMRRKRQMKRTAVSTCRMFSSGSSSCVQCWNRFETLVGSLVCASNMQFRHASRSSQRVNGSGNHSFTLYPAATSQKLLPNRPHLPGEEARPLAAPQLLDGQA